LLLLKNLFFFTLILGVNLIFNSLAIAQEKNKLILKDVRDAQGSIPRKKINTNLYNNNYHNSQLYSLKDLEVLVENKNVKEFLEHALDIRPSNRNKYWNNMTINMAELFLNSLRKYPEIKQTDFNLMERITKWPIITTNEYYFIQRSKISEKFFTKCFSDIQVQSFKECYSQFVFYWNNTQYKDPQHAFNLVKIIERNKPNDYNLNLEYLLKLIPNSNISEFLCKEKRVYLFLFNKLTKIIFESNNKQNKLNKINNNLNSQCWNSFKVFLDSNLTHTNTNIKNFSFNLLNIKNNLSQIQKDLFYIDYLLNYPIKSTIFNNAWRRIEELKSNYSTRKLILEKINNYHSLPDNIVNHFQPKMPKIILTLFYQNFPELLNHYARTCVNYRSGKVKFKRGNPTLNCDKIMNLTKSTNLIPKTFHTDFNKTKL
jgi:hypothetical protein